MGKNKKLGTILLTAFTIFSLGSAFLGTYAWFQSTLINSEYKIDGGSAGAYYASGDGTSQSPYIIAEPRHLYNLAWLQYMGYYNDKNYFFKLSDSISGSGLDMSGYTLPPIGTEKYPFISVFNGNNKIIKNVTTSNDESSLFASTNIHPDSLPVDKYPSGYEAPEIVGFFGVIGNLSGEAYNSSVNSLNNVKLKNINIDTSGTSKTLAGLVAGYSNAAMNKVYVDGYNDQESNINGSSIKFNGQEAVSINGATKLSHYGLVGYTTNTESSGNYSQQLSEFYNSNEDSEGGDLNWGGSIGIKDMYERTDSVYKFVGNSQLTNEASGFAFQKTFNTSPEGVRTQDQSATLTKINSDGNGYLYGYSATSNIGNVRLTGRNRLDGEYDNSQRYLYGLAGGHYEIDNQLSYVQYTTYKIHSGSNFLTISGNSFGNTTNEGSALSWTIPTFEEDMNTTSGYIFTKSGNTTYYLTNNNNALAVVTNKENAQTWDLSKSGNTFEVLCNNYALTYSNGWKLVKSYPLGSSTIASDSTSLTVYYKYPTNAASWGSNCSASFSTTYNPTSGYIVGSSNGWLVEPATSTTATTFEEAAQNTNINYAVYTYCGPFKLYIGWTSGAPLMYTSKGYAAQTLKIAKNGNNFTIRNTRGTPYYLYASGSTWTSGTSARNLTIGDTPRYTLPWNEEGLSIVTSDTDTYISSTSKGWKYDSSEVGYLPLNVVSDGAINSTSNLSNYAVLNTNSKKNTGYLIGGDYTEIDAYGNYLYNRPNSVIISKDLKSTFMNQYSNTVRTIDKNGDDNPVNANDFVNYTRTKELMDDEYLNGDYVYGVHFLGDTVSKDKTFTGTDVVFDKAEGETSFSTFEMPTSCFDFSLRKKGLITFYAATYQNSSVTNIGSDTTNSFFSLHEIVRNSNTNEIEDILEIKQIYTNENERGYSHVYKYSNNKYSLPFKFVNGVKVNIDGSSYAPSYDEVSLPEGYTLAFDCDQQLLLNNNLIKHALYYFEIPINDGEYALGSVTDAAGASLLYLDLGTNGTEEVDETFAYSITTISGSVKFVTGVDFLVVGLDSDLDDGTGGESFHVSVPASNSSTGTLSFTISDNRKEVTVGGSFSTFSYQGNKYGGPSPGSGEGQVFTVSGTIGNIVSETVTTKVLHTHLNIVGEGECDIIVTTITSNSENVTTYTNNGRAVESFENLPALFKSKYAELSNLTHVVTLTRINNTGSGEFITQYDMENSSYVNKIVDVDITTNGVSISIDVISGTFKIGGVTYADESTYPAS